MALCPNCGAANSSDTEFCTKCGAPVSAPDSFANLLDTGVVCPHCDTFNNTQAVKCIRCGKPLTAPSRIRTPLPSPRRPLIREPILAPDSREMPQIAGYGKPKPKPKSTPAPNKADKASADPVEDENNTPISMLDTRDIPKALNVIDALPPSQDNRILAPNADELPQAEGTLFNMLAATPPIGATPPRGHAPARVCPSCRAGAKADDRFCQSCGFSFSDLSVTTPTAGQAVRLRVIASGFGSADQEFVIDAAGSTLGRKGAQHNIDFDPYLSPVHFSLRNEGGSLVLRDEGSYNGTFLRAQVRRELRAGEEFIAGGQRFVLLGAGGPTMVAKAQDADATWMSGSPQQHQLFAALRLMHKGESGNGLGGPVMLRAGPVVSVGSKDCSVCFANDERMAARHFELHLQATKVELAPLDPAAPVFVRIRQSTAVQQGDEILAGEVRFRVETQ